MPGPEVMLMFGWKFSARALLACFAACRLPALCPTVLGVSTCVCGCKLQRVCVCGCGVCVWACPNQPDVVVGNASMMALLASVPGLDLFLNTALLEAGGVAMKGTLIASITTEPVDLDVGPQGLGPPTTWSAAVFVDAG